MTNKISTIPYLGNKGQLAAKLLRHFPPHQTYVEPFAGTAAVLLNKPRVKHEIYNDLDRRLVDLYRVFRHKDTLMELRYRLFSTPYSYALIQDAINYEAEYKEPLENAYMLLIKLFFSKFGTGRGFQNDPSRVKRFMKFAKKALPLIHERLQGVVIECRPWERVIEIYDSKETLFYIDPPYSHSTTHDAHHYDIDGSEDMHTKINAIIPHIKGTAIISGYKDPLYLNNPLLYSQKVMSTKAMRANDKKRKSVEEWIYSNKPIQLAQLELF